jgi:hypothetical protein
VAGCLGAPRGRGCALPAPHYPEVRPGTHLLPDRAAPELLPGSKAARPFGARFYSISHQKAPRTSPGTRRRRLVPERVRADDGRTRMVMQQDLTEETRIRSVKILD